MNTVWVFGDQLNRHIGALAHAEPARDRVLMVEAVQQIASKRYHRQRLHLVLAAMRRLASELATAGFEVDYRRAPTLLDGLAAHRAEHRPDRVVATEPLSWGLRRMLERVDVEMVRSNQFLCHPEEFASWAGATGRFRLEEFYRWQRQRLGYLMDGDQPAGGRWNFDAENRQRPPRDGRNWPAPVRSQLDDLDQAVLADLPTSAFGADPIGLWATSRRAALARLRGFIEEVLPGFGPYEDAMLRSDSDLLSGTNRWRLSHSMLSHALNIGLLLPGEVCDAVEDAYRAGHVPVASAEGFLRQVIGWREYVWNLYWRWMPDWRTMNELDARRPLPPAFLGAPTHMRCVAETIAGIDDRAWVHHIQRLMVLANLAMLAGVSPQAVARWMAASFVDGSEWVMVPNVVGMAMWADGGRVATKPYAAGGAYINRMSDYCGSCAYDPKQRTGPSACPFSTLYWDFIARHADRFEANHRMRQPLHTLRRLPDLAEVRTRAEEVLHLLDEGRL